MKHSIYTLLIIACAWSIQSNAQTPFDSFSPETSRPMLGIESALAVDTVLCAALIDTQYERIFFVDLSKGDLIAIEPITDDIRKWLSVDPLADKYPNISPYAYCNWNPIINIDPDGKNTRIGTPGYENDGVWVSAQNTTYQDPQTSYDTQQMPNSEYFHNQGQLNQGTLQSTFTKESYLQNMPEQDRALVTNPVIQVAAVSVLGAGAISMLNEALPAVVSAGADASTYMNTTLYSAFEGSVPLQIGAGTVEGIIKGVTPGTELTPNLYNSPAYQVGSDLGNSSMFVLKEIRDFFNSSNKK